MQDASGTSHGVLLILVRLHTMVYSKAIVIHLLIPMKGGMICIALVCEKNGNKVIL